LRLLRADFVGTRNDGGLIHFRWLISYQKLDLLEIKKLVLFFLTAASHAITIVAIQDFEILP